jgi:MarR family transcriptional regulator, multiple antibiotic resistance protein MarR
MIAMNTPDTLLGTRADMAPPAAAGQAAEDANIALNIGRLISHVRTAVMEALDRELAPYDISAAQLIVLALLAKGEADSAATLCKGISYDPGAMTRMLDRLEQKGLIRRRPNPEDRRTMNLELTSAGRALYPKLHETKEEVQRRFLRGFSDADVGSLCSLLSRMLANR